MICVIAYLILSYAIVALAMALLLCMPVWRRPPTLRLFGRDLPTKPLIVCLLPLSPLIPYMIVGTETFFLAWTLKPGLEKGLRQSGETDKVRAVRVLWPVWGGAHVYFVQDCKGMGTQVGRSGWTVDLVRKGGKWTIASEPDIVWSDCGSADSNIFPPYLEGF